MKLAMMRIKTEQMHSLLNSTIAQIVDALEAEGVHSVLLKGQAVAQNYLCPKSRSCGDIDLYTGHGGYQKAFEIIESLHEGRAHKEAAECDHHMHTSLNDVASGKSIRKCTMNTIARRIGCTTMTTGS